MTSRFAREASGCANAIGQVRAVAAARTKMRTRVVMLLISHLRPGCDLRGPCHNSGPIRERTDGACDPVVQRRRPADGRRPRRVRPVLPPAGAWLFGIASRKLADYHRRGYAEDRARKRLGMERVELTDADLRRIEGL